MFAVRPVRARAPRYPVSAAAVAVLLATTASFGCGRDGGYYDYDVDGVDAWEGLDCDEVHDEVHGVLTREGWDLVDAGRPIWSPQVEHLGDAWVYQKAGTELLVAGTDDPVVHQAWVDRVPETCPVVAYEHTCDEAHCGEAIAAPCAQLIQAPCPFTDDRIALAEGTTHLLSSLE